MSHDKGGRKGFGLCCVSDNGLSGWINKVTASATAIADDDENYQNPPKHPYNHPHRHHSVVVIYNIPYCQITVYNTHTHTFDTFIFCGLIITVIQFNSQNCSRELHS